MHLFGGRKGIARSPESYAFMGVLCLSPGLLEQRATHRQPKSSPFWGQKSKVQVWAELYHLRKGARPSCFLRRLGLLASCLGLCLRVASSLVAHRLSAHPDNSAWSLNISARALPFSGGDLSFKRP